MKTLLLSLLCLFVWNQTTEALTDQQLSSSTSSKKRYKLQPEHTFNVNKHSTSSKNEDAAAFTAQSVRVESNRK
ncbi:hypothetical protein ROHU_017766 [Labeo rohita]|uniref:Uncharacterized protein n=1 Tax=Labeo rohita TaxID=84645 RepID=A0A498NFP1_LABRO|nr:hypothetical protein ROHU_017766 [Labeo rohita]